MLNIKSKGDELLETRLNEATNPLNQTLNIIASQAFCEQVLSEVEGHQIAVRLLAHKIQSPQEKEALYAFAVLDECIKKCGTRFHQEVGKFRFLNELIKVISPKYLALNMSPNVKKRCIECLYSLYKGIPQEPKIAEAYNMLKKQNIITKDPTYLDDKIFKVDLSLSEKAHSIFDSSKDAQRLAKLLKSRNPDDLREANRLIKSIVQEENNRIEMISKRTLEIDTMKNNVKLMEEMLTHYVPSTATEDDLDIMKQLIESLEKSRADMFRLSREVEDDETLNEIIKVINDSNSVIKTYWDLLRNNINGDSENKLNENSTQGDLLCESFNGSDDLLSKDLQSLGLSDFDSLNVSDKKLTETESKSETSYQDLLDIFNFTKNDQISSNTHVPTNYISASNRKSVPQSNNVPHKQSKISQPESISSSGSVFNKSKRYDEKGFEDLDILSKELLNISKNKDNGMQLIKPFNENQDVELLSTVDDKKTKQSQSSNDLPLLCNDLTLDQMMTLSSDTEMLTSDSHSNSDKVISEVEATIINTSTNMTTTNITKTSNIQSISSELSTEVDLCSFQLSLSNIKPNPLKIPIVLYNNLTSKVKVMLHFSIDRPHESVNVLVAQISSENENQVTDIILKFAITKPMRVYKQPGSKNVLQAHLPFTPSNPLNEIVLIYNPKNESIDLKFHLSYEINGESFLESGHSGSITF